MGILDGGVHQELSVISLWYKVQSVYFVIQGHSVVNNTLWQNTLRRRMLETQSDFFLDKLNAFNYSRV